MRWKNIISPVRNFISNGLYFFGEKCKLKIANCKLCFEVLEGGEISFYIETQRCPACKTLLTECSVREIKEGIQYYDEYTLKCSKCGHVVKKRVWKGSTITGVRETMCPFCGRGGKGHPKTPREPS